MSISNMKSGALHSRDMREQVPAGGLCFDAVWDQGGSLQSTAGNFNWPRVSRQALEDTHLPLHPTLTMSSTETASWYDLQDLRGILVQSENSGNPSLSRWSAPSLWNLEILKPSRSRSASHVPDVHTRRRLPRLDSTNEPGSQRPSCLFPQK